MRATYQPPRFNFNRFCHRLAGLLRPEAHFSILPITIPQVVIVPDTSTYEGRLDIGKMIATGAAGVIAKASQGYWEDDQFANTWASARGLLPRGCYHFFDPRYSPTQQLNTFVPLVQNEPGELPLVVDWEASWTGPYLGWSNLYAFLEGLKKEFPGRRIMIYTGYYYWQDHSPNPITQPGSLAYFGQYDLWLAWYADASVVRIPKPWTALTFWQYTDSGPGPTYGAQSNAIDLNYYNGTRAMFDAEFGTVSQEPVLHTVERLSAEVELCQTPELELEPFRDAVAQAAAYGWSSAMTGGAGYHYENGNLVMHGSPEFEYFLVDGKRFTFSRRLVDQGAVNPNLDITYRAPWCVLAFDPERVHIAKLISEGQEPGLGFTQMELARKILALGYTEAFLMDSGHGAQLEQDGVMLYSAYGEPVPLCIGCLEKGISMTTYQAQERLGKTVTKRTSPEAVSGNSSPLGSVLPHATVDYTEIVGDLQHPGDPNYQWLHLTDGTYVNYYYPSATIPNYQRFDLLTQPPAPPPPPASAPFHVELVDNVAGKTFIGDLNEKI